MTSKRDVYALLGYVLLAFGLTWAVWSPVCLKVADFKGLGVLIIALGMWGPGLAALLVTWLVVGESWRSTTLGCLGRWRYYLWAWLLPLAGTAVATGLTVLFGVARFDPEFSVLGKMFEAAGQTPPVPLWIIVAAQVAAGLTVAPLLNALFAVGEEIGWRGFLLPGLVRAGLPQWQALLLSGVIWGLWHAPVVALLGHNYPDHPYLGILLMTVFCTLVGMIFGWLQLASGSVWVPAIAHGALNAIAGLPMVVLTKYDTALGGMLTSVIGWIPLLAFIGWLYATGRLPVAVDGHRSPA